MRNEPGVSLIEPLPIALYQPWDRRLGSRIDTVTPTATPTVRVPPEAMPGHEAHNTIPKMTQSRNFNHVTSLSHSRYLSVE